MIELDTNLFDDMYDSLHFEYNNSKFEVFASRWNDLFISASQLKGRGYSLERAKLAMSFLNQITKLRTEELTEEMMLSHVENSSCSRYKNFITNDSIESAFYLVHITDDFKNQFELHDLFSDIQFTAKELVKEIFKVQIADAVSTDQTEIPQRKHYHVMTLEGPPGPRPL